MNHESGNLKPEARIRLAAWLVWLGALLIVGVAPLQEGLDDPAPCFSFSPSPRSWPRSSPPGPA